MLATNSDARLSLYTHNWEKKVCFFVLKLGFHEAGDLESGSQSWKVWKRRPVPGFVLKPKHKSRLSLQKRHFALLVISEHKLPVSSLRLFSAALQMRRSATKRCLCASRINRESRSCLFALNTRSKFYTDAVCFLFKRNLQPNCWQAFAPAGLTVCVNSPQHTSVLAVCRLCHQFIQNTPSTGATHMSGFERNFSVSNCWASLSRRVRYLNSFFLRLFCKFRQTRSDCWVVLWRRLCLMSVGPVRGKVHSRVSLCLLNFERRCCFSSFVGRFQQDSSENSFLQLRRFISICADFVPEVILCFKSSWENEKNTAGIWNGTKF